ncbi:hypothetical protein JOM56_000396 [Amanita muscaria]|uniref:Uncharacterized protein n=1 Tax=Amanita muscaria (strain Koide BX008) TaxID=946122 RepID=A0A0C2T3L0_AMAMK|nr:hypothetical protein M378DRAFT_180223 [Amanita muscaria Koide BX008]
MSCDASSSSSRPTLPPLRDLNLPIPNTRNMPSFNDDSYDYKPYYIPQKTWNYNRQASISSSVTSRSPSPITSDYFATQSPYSPNTPSPTDAPLKVRLVPCSFESADAYVYVPPSSASPSSAIAPKVSDTIQGQLQGNQPLLLVGSAAKQLRQPTQKIVKGARLHPYRITRSAGPPKRFL